MRRIFPLILLSLIPAVVLAASPTYDLLSPLGGMTTGVDLKTYLQSIIKVTIGIAGVLAVVMIVICGIKVIMSGSVSGKSEAKECITNAIFGLLIAISAWALLYTLNPDLLKNDLQLADVPIIAPLPGSPGGPPAPGPTVDPMPTEAGTYFRYKDAQGNTKNSPKYETSTNACLPAAATQEKNSPGSVLTTNGTQCFDVQKSTTTPSPSGEAATRNAICGNDLCKGSTPLAINKSPCVPPEKNGVTGGCTNVNGLPGDTITFLKSLPGGCSCNVIITGGTENGHSSHGPNIPVFDLGKATALVSFIKTSASVKNNPSFCTTTTGSCHFKWLYNGYWFTDEGDHFHVCKDGTPAPAGKSVTLFKKACTQT